MARTAPVTTPPREFSNMDMPTRQLDPVEDGPREPDVIVADELELTNKQYLEELAFMEETLEVVLHKGSEKYSPLMEQVGVNGTQIWIPVDTPVALKRKYVEILARSQPIDITTESGESPGDELVFNRVKRNQRRNFSFSILKDPSPKGQAWLAKVMRES